MGVVDDLDEGLDAAAAGNLLLSHALGDLLGSAGDTSDNGECVLARIGTIIVLLDDHSLLSGILAVKHDNCSSSLQTDFLSKISEGSSSSKIGTKKEKGSLRKQGCVCKAHFRESLHPASHIGQRLLNHEVAAIKLRPVDF